MLAASLETTLHVVVVFYVHYNLTASFEKTHDSACSCSSVTKVVFRGVKPWEHGNHSIVSWAGHPPSIEPAAHRVLHCNIDEVTEGD
eukprot:m.458718 g.458718  ORF g.458718 m.458718 type:complete len:87 (+) comp20337_c2_seq31:1315-1575(+)